MQKEQIKEEVKSEVEPHPLDVNYNLLNCDLTLLGKKSKEFKVRLCGGIAFDPLAAGGYSLVITD